MDPSNYLLIFFIVLLILFSAYFASVESALSSMNKIRIKKHADDGDRRAKRALKLEANYERTITVLLIGNNIAHIACASLTTVLSVNVFAFLKESYGYSPTEAAMTAIATAVTTVVIFFAGEM
ncbi:MAG: DUF21 domain-containing protein, partial [Clostridia bacterium]|nr:DUF21 domain-containing protein [Clostridia bacterium]